ncbi:hypothetical protein [Frankia sp. CcI49]|uniref:hypothetical protein n=1 Tax=Frankia sp. CcI49 TaxID=1745382 RepID=UPI0013046F85|nr:hypothetical protein [Frankia sp. CcI49]
MPGLSEEEKARRALNRRRKAAVEAEERAIRDEDRQREWREKGMLLTYAEMRAGVPCRGCGLPILDGLGSQPPLMKMTESERQEYEIGEAEFRSRHADCHAFRWTVSGSRTQHCGYCCPPHPLSDQQIDHLAKLFRGFGTPNPAELDTWRLSLTCEHIADVTQHSSNTTFSRSVVRCEQCGQTRGIVDAEKLPPTETRRIAEERRLVTAVTQARENLDRHERQVASARRRVQKLERDLQNSRGDSATTEMGSG